jgi:hypothetical protein
MNYLILLHRVLLYTQILTQMLMKFHLLCTTTMFTRTCQWDISWATWILNHGWYTTRKPNITESYALVLDRHLYYQLCSLFSLITVYPIPFRWLSYDSTLETNNLFSKSMMQSGTIFGPLLTNGEQNTSTNVHSATATALLLTVHAHPFTPYINKQSRLSVSVVIHWHVGILCGSLL